MKFPIIVIELDTQELSVYASPERATNAMEAVDVIDGLYKAFDADGLPLKIIVSDMPRQLIFGPFGIVGGGKLSLADDPFNDAEERRWFIRFLKNYDKQIELSGLNSDDAQRTLDKIKNMSELEGNKEQKQYY